MTLSPTPATPATKTSGPPPHSRTIAQQLTAAPRFTTLNLAIADRVSDHLDSVDARLATLPAARLTWLDEEHSALQHERDAREKARRAALDRIAYHRRTETPA
jgi:hypothetical protein